MTTREETTLQITADMVKELRDRTGAGVMDAKRALEEAGGDQKQAEEGLRKKGLAAAAKRAGRETYEGVVHAYIHQGSRIGALVELNCETDFVARTPEFQDLARDIAMQVAAMSPRFVNRQEAEDSGDQVGDEEILLEQAYIRDPSVTVNDVVTQVVAKTGENCKVRRFTRFALGE